MGAAAASRDTFGGALMALQNTIDGLLTGSEGSLDGAKVAIDDLNRALSDPLQRNPSPNFSTCSRRSVNRS